MSIDFIRGVTVHNPGNGAAVLKMGGWRVIKPILDMSKCNSCKLCYWFCPDDTVNFKKGDVSINYDYCKGCGVCAVECPQGAIVMVKEGQA